MQDNSPQQQDLSCTMFLSYSVDDRALAGQLREKLAQQHPSSRIFFSEASIKAGDNWIPALADEIERADVFILLLGDRVGPWQEREYYEAFRLANEKSRKDKPKIIPLILAEQAPGLKWLTQFHCIPTSKEDILNIEAIKKLQEAITSPDTSHNNQWRIFNPYQGLERMTACDAQFFFGRQDLTADILTEMSRSTHRLLVLSGASGVGKSSLAEAGVTSALATEAWPIPDTPWPVALKDSSKWHVISLRPGDRPLRKFTYELIKLFTPGESSARREQETDEWFARFSSGALLDDILTRVAEIQPPKTSSPRFFFYIDQGEELYTKASKADFLSTKPVETLVIARLLAEACRRNDCHVLMSLRSDYTPLFEADDALQSVAKTITVRPLTKSQLAEVIREPARILGVQFESEAMVPILSEAAERESGALPLLSFMLTDAWTRMQKMVNGDGVLRWSQNPEILDLSLALRERADQFLRGHEDKMRAITNLFTLRLATVSIQGGPTIRRLAKSSEIEDRTEWEIAEELASKEWRLLTLSRPEDDEPTVEVAHEKLFEKWPSLVGWLEQEREFLVLRSEIEVAHKQWTNTDPTQKDTALLMGRLLERVRHIGETRKTDLGLRLAKFLDDSIARDQAKRAEQDAKDEALEKEKRGRAKAEFDKQRTEWEARRQSLEQKERFNEERIAFFARRKRLLLTTTSVLAIFCVGLIGLAYLLRIQYNNAEIEKKRATASEQSANFSKEKAELSIALAAHSAEKIVGEISTGLIEVQGVPQHLMKNIFEEARNLLNDLSAHADYGPLYETRATALVALMKTNIKLNSLAEAQKAADLAAHSFQEAAKRQKSDFAQRRYQAMAHDASLIVGKQSWPRAKLHAVLFESLELWNTVARGREPIALRRIAGINGEIAYYYLGDGNPKVALSFAESAISNLQSAISGGGTSEEVLEATRVKPFLLMLLGDIKLADGNKAEARTAWKGALQLWEEDLKERPVNASLRFAVTEIKLRFGDLLFFDGLIEPADTASLTQGIDQVKTAVFYYNEAWAERRDLVRLVPDNCEFSFGLSQIYERMGRLHAAKGRIANAQTHFGRALGIREALYRADPENARWSLSLADGYANSAAVEEGSNAEKLRQAGSSLLATLRKGNLIGEADARRLESILTTGKL